MQDWPNKKEHSMGQWWPIRNELAMIDGITMRGKRIIVPFQLQKHILQQMHINYMGIEKMIPQATSAKISILVKYECRYSKYCETV